MNAWKSSQGWECYDWATVCKESSTPVLTPEEWAAYFGVAHLVYDEDLRKDHEWTCEISPMDGRCECQPAESDWYTISDQWISVYWEFVGDPPDVTEPGTYTLKAVFANDTIPAPVRCNPCVCPDGTENCEACQKCPAKKVPNLRDPDVERLFTIWVVDAEIMWPKDPKTVAQGGALEETFVIAGGCYRQSRDAVVITALGELANKALAWVAGQVRPGIVTPLWEMIPELGTLDPTNSTNPDHTPPADPYYAPIRFTAMHGEEDTGCAKQVEVWVFEGHLDRDLWNFHTGKRCSPNPPALAGAADHLPCTGGTTPGLQLADDSCVAGLSLTCGASVSHATIGNHAGWNQTTGLIGHSVVDGVKTWQQFEQMQIQRGDIIQLGYYPAGSSVPTNMQSIHVCVAIQNGPGSLLWTHAGDTMSGVFRRENPEGYYSMMWSHAWIPQEQNHIIQGASSLEEWLDLYARLKVWRRNASGE